MADPVLHLIAGPNGAGKSTLHERVVGPATGLELVNADVIALRRWLEDAVVHGYEASRLAAERRAELLAELLASRRSFATETVFSHGSKVDLVRDAADAGYLVVLHVVLVPEELAVLRVANRVANGGHDVPEEKARWARLWPLVVDAIGLVDEAIVYDNSSAGAPFRVVASFERGAAVGTPAWPRWAPEVLRRLA